MTLTLSSFYIFRSEGPQPHNIDLAFPRKVYISVSSNLITTCPVTTKRSCFKLTISDSCLPAQSVHICLSHSNDDSYTPERIGILLGTSHYDLVEVGSQMLSSTFKNDLSGWLIILSPLAHLISYHFSIFASIRPAPFETLAGPLAPPR